MSAPLPADVRLRLRIYNALFPFALLLMLPGLLRRMRKRGGYRAHFAQRFGRYEPEVVTRLHARSRVWIQSISVGETILALKLAREIRAQNPAEGVVISVQTSTGYEIAQRAASEWVEVIYNPLDLPAFTRRAVATIRPQRFVVIEGMWPNLLAQCRAAGVPAAMIARLSPRAERRFRRFRWFTAPFFRLLKPICVAEQDDFARWISLGVPADSLALTGNLKYDEPPADLARVEEFRTFLTALGVPRDAPILLGGSTFPGEEKILAEVFIALRKSLPALFLILVPRHFERTPEVLAELSPLPLKIALRTEQPSEGAEVLIINTNGELRTWYELATVVFIGKSLTATGGQNPVEAALAGKPVIFGPHMENFAPIVRQWLNTSAAIQVSDQSNLMARTQELLRDEASRKQLAAKARQAVELHQGAAARSAALILRSE